MTKILVFVQESLAFSLKINEARVDRGIAGQVAYSYIPEGTGTNTAIPVEPSALPSNLTSCVVQKITLGKKEKKSLWWYADLQLCLLLNPREFRYILYIHVFKLF